MICKSIKPHNCNVPLCTIDVDVSYITNLRAVSCILSHFTIRNNLSACLQCDFFALWAHL